jgi:hypothetical protein
LAPADFLFVPKVEIHSERSPISDDRRDKIKFATGPTSYPAKLLPDHLAELEKSWKLCIDSGAVYFEEDKFY